uniref:Coated vesicle membrane protein n=1 Tax=Solanum tuberosum TaxID=4113 RepID=M0ZYV4_SOLTU
MCIGSSASQSKSPRLENKQQVTTNLVVQSNGSKDIVCTNLFEALGVEKELELIDSNPSKEKTLVRADPDNNIQSVSTPIGVCSMRTDKYGNVMSPTVAKAIQESQAAMLLKPNSAIKPPMVTLSILAHEVTSQNLDSPDEHQGEFGQLLSSTGNDKILARGDTIHVSFVVIQADTPWHSANKGGVDLMIKGPSGELIHGFRDKTSEKYEFVAYKKGIYQFCFTNKSPYHETLEFDVQVVHYTYYDQHAKNEHFDPLLDQLSKLEAALYNIQFEQHWLEAHTARQALLNEGMSQRAITKALLESVTLVGVCFLQVFLLQRLFENKLQTVRV